MNAKAVEEIANAVLYEGYLLYPYRASSIKNQQRWNFGVLYPREYAEKQSGADTWKMQTECLVIGAPAAKIEVRVRFLHLIGQGAMEQRMDLPSTDLRALSAPVRGTVTFPGMEDQQAVHAAVELSATQLWDGVVRIRVVVSNNSGHVSTTREDALLHSLVSTHAILQVQGGEFVSLLEPPENLIDAARACDNRGVWPVLVGDAKQRFCMLASPIILYDYPQIAPESPGALFDGTEIDEILTLRILTLSDAEKQEIASGDEHARQILERTECMPQEQFMKLHGVLRPAGTSQEQP
jgi:hypothetical protein